MIMQCQKKNIFICHFFPNEESMLVTEMHTVQKGFASSTQQSSEQLLRGTHGRQECDAHPLRLPGTDILAEGQGNRCFVGEGGAAWPGGVRARQDLYQREGKPGEGSRGSKRVECTSQKQIPAKQRLRKGPETGRDKACWRRGAGQHKAL